MVARRTGLTAAVLFAATGCTSEAAPDASTPVVVTVGSDWSMFPEALVSGHLSVDDAGCVRLDDRVVVWPSGTEWDAGAKALVFAADASAPLAEGDAFTGGGGSLPMRIWRESLDPETTTALEACLTARDDGHALFAYP